MGNDFSSVIRRAGIITEMDTSNAYFMFDNALRNIFKNSPKEYTIIAHGNCNVLIKTHTIPERYYRICFRAYLPEVTQRMIKTYNVIRQRDYGFMIPPEAYITDDYIYYRIELIEPLNNHPSYDDMYRIFQKLLPLAEHGLAWLDYKPSNLGIINGNYVIIDFECIDEEDIEDSVKSTLQRLNLPRKPEAINRWIKAHPVRCSIMNPYYLIILIGLIYGYMDPFRLMRLLFNYWLFRRKNNIHYRWFNDDIYRFMMETPFALL